MNTEQDACNRKKKNITIRKNMNMDDRDEQDMKKEWSGMRARLGIKINNKKELKGINRDKHLMN